jgi:hypothetical protein
VPELDAPELEVPELDPELDPDPLPELADALCWLCDEDEDEDAGDGVAAALGSA